MASRDIVKLNIGGTVFQTSKSTLTKFNGFFKTMFETDIPLQNDESGCIFIDRDAKHFRLILNYMRDGHVALPDSQKEIEEIQQEAQYYLLDGLVELCNACLPFIDPMRIKLNVSGTIFHTTIPTLTENSQIFRDMFQEGVPIQKDESECVFINRSAKHFEQILSYMRDGHIICPDGIKDILEIRTEAEYYQLEGLTKLCTRNIPVESSDQIKFIKTDEEMLKIVSDLLRSYEGMRVLIIYGYTNENGFSGCPSGFIAENFVRKFEDRFNVYFRMNHDETSEKEWRYAIYSRSPCPMIGGLLENMEDEIRNYLIF